MRPRALRESVARSLHLHRGLRIDDAAGGALGNAYVPAVHGTDDAVTDVSFGSAAVSWLAAKAGCDAAPSSSWPTGGVELTLYPRCGPRGGARGGTLAFFLVDGGAHAMPSAALVGLL